MGRNGTAFASRSRKAALFPQIPNVVAAVASSRVPPTRKLVGSAGHPPPRYPRGRSEPWAPTGVPELRERKGWGSAGQGRSGAAGRRGGRVQGGAGAGGGDSGSCGATDQAGQRRAHREREVRVAQRSHVSVPGPLAGRGTGASVPVPPLPAPARRSRICYSGCGPVPHHPIPGTPASRCPLSPPPVRGGRSFAPQKPPPPGLPRPALPPSHSKAQAAGAPRPWSGPGLRAGPRRQPEPWHDRSAGAPAAFATGEAELGMGRGR